MIYGIHIGIILASFLIVQANWRAKSELTETIRVIGLFLLTVSLCSFIGLTIAKIIKTI